MKYQECPKCGSALDFGEICHCTEEKENEPPHANENSSPSKINKILPYLNYSTNTSERQDETEEKYNTEKAIAAQKAYCDKNGLTNFAPAFDGTCFYCGINIYEPYSEGNKRPTGYTVEEAGRRHIFFCPHCHKSFLD